MKYLTPAIAVLFLAAAAAVQAQEPELTPTCNPSSGFCNRFQAGTPEPSSTIRPTVVKYEASPAPTRTLTPRVVGMTPSPAGPTSDVAGVRVVITPPRTGDAGLR